MMASAHNEELSLHTLAGGTNSSDPSFRFIGGIFLLIESSEFTELIELKLVQVTKDSCFLYTGIAPITESPDPSNIALFCGHPMLS